VAVIVEPQRSASLVLILTEVIGLSSTGIALAMAVVQLLCMTGAYETIRSVRAAVKQTMSHIVNECPLTKFPGGIQALHTADKDAVKWLHEFSIR